jgi:uncharacterized protein (DUF2236 family)
MRRSGTWVVRTRGRQRGWFGRMGIMTGPSRPQGTGPGVITPDGCAVDFYARMTADGAVIIQQHAPGWFAAAADSENVRDGIIFRLRDVSRPAPKLVSATVEYADGDRVWTQTFTARRLDDAEMTAVLAGSGLRLDRYLTDDHSWLCAVPA